jgi:hypothetical protein
MATEELFEKIKRLSDYAKSGATKDEKFNAELTSVIRLSVQAVLGERNTSPPREIASTVMSEKAQNLFSQITKAMRQTGLALLDERNASALRDITSSVMMSGLVQSLEASNVGQFNLDDAHKDLGWTIVGAAVGAAIGGFLGGAGGATTGALVGAAAGLVYSINQKDPPHHEED